MKYNAPLQWTEVYNSSEWEAFTSPWGALTDLVGVMDHLRSGTLRWSRAQYLLRTKILHLNQKLDCEPKIRRRVEREPASAQGVRLEIFIATCKMTINRMALRQIRFSYSSYSNTSAFSWIHLLNNMTKKRKKYSLTIIKTLY